MQVNENEIGGRVKQIKDEKLPKANRRDGWKDTRAHQVRRAQRRFAKEVI